MPCFFKKMGWQSLLYGKINPNISEHNKLIMAWQIYCKLNGELYTLNPNTAHSRARHTLSILQNTPSTVHYASSTLHTIRTEQCMKHIQHWRPFYSALFNHISTKHTEHCSLYTKQYTLYTQQCTLHTQQYILYTQRCTLYTQQYTLYTQQCTLHTQQCTFYT